MSANIHYKLSDLPERYQRQLAKREYPCTANDLMRKMGFHPAQGNVPRTVKVSSVVRNGITDTPKSLKTVERSYRPTEVRNPPIRELQREMSRPERCFQRDILGGKGRYEAITLKLAGGSRYTPDFFFMDGDVPVLVEVKGNYRLGSEGRARTAFMEAAAEFPMFRFVWAVKEKGGVWDIKMQIPSIVEESKIF